MNGVFCRSPNEDELCGSATWLGITTKFQQEPLVSILRALT
jgi:hypothetical protein